MDYSTRFVIHGQHPALAGHFPGRPIVPGVVLLDHAAAAMLNRRPESRLAGFTAVKFASTVLPDDEVEMAWTERPGGEMSFVLSVAGRTVLKGAARLRPAAQ
jgi:3-hydroxyacyl-[acyl-carrier-protein] dehydratase